MKTFKLFLEAENRTPRKKGQHTGSSSHSDLYTDEDPKGTIKGLGFKDAATAKNGIAIINKSDRTHAHKVQATLVMQQRAKVAMGRTKDPEKKKNLKAAFELDGRKVVDLEADGGGSIDPFIGAAYYADTGQPLDNEELDALITKYPTDLEPGGMWWDQQR